MSQKRKLPAILRADGSEKELLPMALVFISLCLTVLAACTGASRSSAGAVKTAGTISFESCRPQGFGGTALCGILQRPENPDAADGRQISLNIVLLPSRSPHPEPDPLYIIAGGPGQAATETISMLRPLADSVLRDREIVLVDQRGTGKSNALLCEKKDGGETRKTIGQKIMEEAARPLSKRRENILKCLEQTEEHADPRFYGTRLAVEDLDAVRRASGHGKINLWGISYGTRVVLDYLKIYSENVRAAVLDGVVPPNISLIHAMGGNGMRAIEKTLDDCNADEKCAAAFPDIGRKFFDMEVRASKNPLHFSVPDPLSGSPAEVDFSADFVGDVFRNLLYDADMASLIPLTVDALNRGDAAAFLAQAAMMEDAAGGIADGMHLSVMCGEGNGGKPPTSEPLSEDSSASPADFFSEKIRREYGDLCALWPPASVPADFYSPVTSDVPTLILSGKLDPVTPPAYGEMVAASLNHVRHVISPGIAHGVSVRGCGPRVVSKFLSSPDPAAVDADCLEKIARPPFFLSFAGPSP